MSLGTKTSETATITFHGTTLTGNQASQEGGGAYVAGGGSLSMSSCEVRENAAGGRGGAMSVADAAGTVTMANTFVKANAATDANAQGGGVYSVAPHKLALTDVAFEDKPGVRW